MSDSMRMTIVLEGGTAVGFPTNKTAHEWDKIIKDAIKESDTICIPNVPTPAGPGQPLCKERTIFINPFSIMMTDHMVISDIVSGSKPILMPSDIGKPQ